MAHQVSVIIPVYNVEKYLARCLDSVLSAAEGTDTEIVCVDDGSTDSSPALLKRYADRVRIVTKPNGGLSSARNAGLDVADGDYIMFVDSDDWIPEDAIRKFLKAAEESGAPVVVSNALAKDVLPSPRAAHCQWRIQKPALEMFVSNRRIHSSVCNKLYRRDVIGLRRFIEGIYFEDWPFNTELFADIPLFALVDEPMYVYSTGDGSITRSPFSLEKVKGYLAGIAHVSEFFRGRQDASIAARRVAVAVKMLVGKTVKSGDAALERLVAAQDFSALPLDMKTRFRLWKIRKPRKGRITLTHIRKQGCDAVISLSVSSDLRKYFRERTLRLTYPESIETVPDSVLAVPFVANIAPLVWLADAELVVPKLDAAFLACLDRVRDGYRQMFAGRCTFAGRISAVPERNTSESRVCRAATFFSGGLDSVCTLLSHLQERPDLLVIWGADIKYDNIAGWSRLEEALQIEAKRYALPLKAVRSTFRRMLNTRRLNRDFKSVLGDEWWHGVQHGLALLGHVAPLTFIRGYEMMYIASSCTDLKAICASSPLTDNAFRCVNCRAVHDGFEMDRMAKTARVLTDCKNLGIRSANLHVCWQSRTGLNCCSCEKCLRTIVGILANGGDPVCFGFEDFEQVFNAESAKQIVLHELRTHRDIGNGIKNWSTIGECLRRKGAIGPCSDDVKAFLSWLADLDFEGEAARRPSSPPRRKKGILAVTCKHSDIKYALGGVTILKRAAKRTSHGAQFTYRLFSKIPVWTREERALTLTGPSEPPADFRPQDVDTSVLLTALHRMEPFTYIPNPGNAGDALIAAGTLQFFERHALRYRLFAGDYSGNVVLGGGGGFVSYYPKFVRRILHATAVSDQVLILPSTFHEVDDFLAAIDGRFTLFARDRESFACLEQSGTRARIFLGHDMSLCLTAEMFRRVIPVSVLERELQKRLLRELSGLQGTLHVMRTDIESAGPQSGDIDLSRCYYLNEWSSPDWIFFGARLFLEAIDRFDTIVTDRLHVGIGAILLGKRLVWRDNRYHKIGNIYDFEFKGRNDIRLVSSDASQKELR